MQCGRFKLLFAEELGTPTSYLVKRPTIHYVKTPPNAPKHSLVTRLMRLRQVSTSQTPSSCLPPVPPEVAMRWGFKGSAPMVTERVIQRAQKLFK